MYGLMSLWFGPLVEFDADLGYFHLCPACHDEFVAPELERIQNSILELHPGAGKTPDEEETTSISISGAISSEGAGGEAAPDTSTGEPEGEPHAEPDDEPEGRGGSGAADAGGAGGGGAGTDADDEGANGP